jgi:hypothetical protein
VEPSRGGIGPGSVLAAVASGLASLAASLSGWRSALTLVVLALVAHSAWSLGRPWVRYFLFKDRIAEIASAPVEDRDLREPIGRAIRAQGLEAYLSDDDCEVESRGPWRRVRCGYDQPVELLPGLTRTLRFRFEVERPFLAPEEPKSFR